MKKDKRPEWKKVVVDGDTLEKRRDQRAEQLEKYVWERDPDQGPGVLDAVTQWTKETGAEVVPASQSLYDLEAEEKKLRQVENETALLGQDLDPVVKRTPQQRIESLAKRLRDSEPAFIEPILKELVSEYWKAGMPVSTEDLRAVASALLNQADRRKKEK